MIRSPTTAVGYTRLSICADRHRTVHASYRTRGSTGGSPFEAGSSPHPSLGQRANHPATDESKVLQRAAVRAGRFAVAAAPAAKGGMGGANPSLEMPSPCEPEGPQGLGKKEHPTRLGVRQEAS
jgi:hypothetical protein